MARANVLAMQADAQGHCYNVGRGIGTSVKELTELLLRLSESRLPIQYEPAGLTFVTNRIGCPRRAKRDLGYRWTVDLEQGMRSLIEWREQNEEALGRKRMAVGGLQSV